VQPRAVVVGALVLLAGCGRTVAHLDDTDLASVVLVELEPEPYVRAYDLADEGLELAARDGITTYALGYGASLAALELPTGELRVGPTGAPLPAALRERALAPGESEWTPMVAPSKGLSALRLPDGEPCRTFEAISYSMPVEPGDYPTLALPIDDARVLVATVSGRFYQVQASGVEPLSLPRTTPHIAGFARDGELWLVGPGTEVVVGTPDRGFTRMLDLPFAAPPGSSIDGSPADSPLEVYVADHGLRVARFDGERWRILLSESRPIAERVRARVSWLSERAFVMLGTGIARVVEHTVAPQGWVLSEAVIELDIPVRSSPDSLWTMDRLSDAGPIIGTRNNVLFARRSDGWVRLVEGLGTPRADVIFGSGDGHYYSGGQGGLFVERRPWDEACPPLELPAGPTARAAAPLADGFVVVSTGLADDGFVVTVARRVRL
jgi:hypothetical protein